MIPVVPVPVVMDTDPGQDDALAILLALASPGELEVLALHAVCGNVPVAQAAVNIGRICRLAGRADAPVRAGAAAPLVYPLETAEFICGPNGLAGHDLPLPAAPLAEGHAAPALSALLRAARAPVTLLMLGPLTNLALALRLDPGIVPQVARVVVMGGSRDLGNMTPAAEFNAYIDPHAAAVVLGAGWPVTLVGLHVTQTAVASAEDVAAFATLGTATGRAVHGWLTRPRPGGLGGHGGHPMHDLLVVAWVLWPDLFMGRDCWVAVECGPGTLRGRTTIDWRGRTGQPPNAHVLGTVDAPALFARVVERLRGLP